jgi:hypothetical protein
MDNTKTQACQWKYCESECSWDTQCDNKYQFMNDGPKELDANAQQDICGLCGKPGADKIPHPMHWPGERIPETDLVHGDCERLECEDAFVSYRRRVGEDGIKQFLRSIYRI